MEQYELELVEKYRSQDGELQALWDEHQRFERELEKIASKPYLTPSEDLSMKELKKKKLAGKTKIQQILEKLQQQEV